MARGLGWLNVLLLSVYFCQLITDIGRGSIYKVLSRRDDLMESKLLRMGSPQSKGKRTWVWFAQLKNGNWKLKSSGLELGMMVNTLL